MELLPTLGVSPPTDGHKMTYRLLTVSIVALALMIASPALYAQSCRTNADTSAYLRERVKTYALATDSIGTAVRDSLRIKAVASATGVVSITSETTCRKANKAYQMAIAGGQRNTFSGKVYVVQSGKSFIVWDPSFRYSPVPAAAYIVFDSKWAKQSIFK